MNPEKFLRSAAPALLVLGLSAAAMAQPFVYALNAKGKLSINGTLLDSLPSDFDPDPLQEIEEAWADVSVVGADRHALRGDGRIFKNGIVLTNDLPFEFGFPTTYFWTALSATPTAVYALRQNGELAADGIVVVDFSADDFFFPDVLGADPNVYSLRTDGRIFENTTTSAKFHLKAGAGPGGFDDGESPATSWIAMAIDPTIGGLTSGDLFALRLDGEIFMGDLPSGVLAGTAVGALPPPGSADPDPEEAYIDIEFASDGTWYVLRGDGAVFDPAHLVVPLVDLPGDASSLDSTFVDLATNGTDFWAIRGDGRLYRNTDGLELANFDSDFYQALAVSTTPPDLTNFKNAKPVVSAYKTTAIAGSPVSIPVVATDTDKRSADLLVSLLPAAKQPASFPPGFVFTPSAGTTSIRGTLDGTAPAEKGSYSMKVSVDDGVTGAKTFTYKLKVVEMDADPLKDKKPLLAKIKKIQAVVVGAPPLEVLEFRILAVDADGDAITLSFESVTGAPVDPLTGLPFGATFDMVTGLFTWSPDLTQLGLTKITFVATAGALLKKMTVKIDVKSGLIF